MSETKLTDFKPLQARIAALEAELAEANGQIEIHKRYHRKPTHGPCCTCQHCGLLYDDCRCDLDEVSDELEKIKQQLSTARAEERERCAKVACEYCHDGYFFGPGPKYEHTVGGYSVKCKAAAIRNLKD